MVMAFHLTVSVVSTEVARDEGLLAEDGLPTSFITTGYEPKGCFSFWVEVHPRPAVRAAWCWSPWSSGAGGCDRGRLTSTMEIEEENWRLVPLIEGWINCCV